MAAPDFEERLKQFQERLRQQAPAAATHGVGRVLGSLRGAAGLATAAWSARRQGGTWDAADLGSLEALVTRLGTLKGLPMKAGQIMGFLEADLPEEMRRLLALLQTQSPATPFAQVERVLREDLGPRAEALLSTLERAPVAVASIGQVHCAVLPAGTRVAVKVRHPQVEETIRSDLQGAAAGTALASVLVPGAGATAREFVEEAQARLLEECDYAREARCQQRFGQLFAAHPDVVVPAVFPDWCGPRVLTSAWEAGQGLEAFAAQAPQESRNRAGRALFDVYLGALYRHGLFHADPHPGNYAFREGGRTVVFDYGCVREFPPEAVRAFVDLAVAVREDRDAGIRAALSALGAEPPASPEALAHIKHLLQQFFSPFLRRGAHRVDSRLTTDFQQVMRDKLALARLRLPGKLLFLFRIRFGLYAVLARLGATCDWSALEQDAARSVP